MDVYSFEYSFNIELNSNFLKAKISALLYAIKCFKHLHDLLPHIWLIFTRSNTPLEICRWFPQFMFTLLTHVRLIKGCTLKGSQIKGSRFIVYRLSFSLDSRDVFLSLGQYEICLGHFYPHDCTPNNLDAMNKLCTHTTYHKGKLVYTHNVLICQTVPANKILLDRRGSRK